ncbi:MAG: MFS transporter, partial [Thaumarchaeota archaeon]|nr:MFS transporter [Nitrososphaerota archaeon]
MRFSVNKYLGLQASEVKDAIQETSATVTAPRTGTSPQAVGVTPTKRNALLIIVGALLALSLGVMDVSIVGTAGPTIISDLGGLSLYAWVFSVYTLAQLVSMPILGKLSDIYGRKRFLMAGLVIFIAGSILSGASQNIDQL